MVTPHYQRYISPKERAETRARWMRFGYGLAVAIPIFVAVMLFAYTDQAPRWLREAAFVVDRLFGFPILYLIQTLFAR